MENYENWEFENLNMIFGTDSQPFVSFIHKDGKIVSSGVKSNMSLRNHQSVVRLDQHRLIFSGGVNHLFNKVTSKTYGYNILTSEYSKMGNLINRRFFAQLVFIKGRLFIIGGRDYGNDSVAILKSCEEYDFGQNKWNQTADLNFHRCNFSSLVFQDMIYVFSGLSKTSDLLNSIERFDLTTNSWQVLGLEVSENMLGNLSFSKGNKIVVLGGTRSWGSGAIVKLNLEFGADLGSTFVKKLPNKNALAKPVVLDQHILAFGGFFNHLVLLNKKSLSIEPNSTAMDPYQNIIDHVEKLCLQSFRLTKCSYVLPLENLGGKL